MSEKRLKILYKNLANPSLGHLFRFAHRLDYSTSGCLCVCFNKEAAAEAAKAFGNNRVTKHYLALVRGHVTPGEGNSRTIDICIGKDTLSDNPYKQCEASKPGCVDVKKSLTELHVLEHGTYEGLPASKLLLRPQTGRMHQLRVHCDYIGHRIIGDFTYSNREDVSPFRMMLHAYSLTIYTVKSTDGAIHTTAEDPFTSTCDPKWTPVDIIAKYNDIIKSLGKDKALLNYEDYLETREKQRIAREKHYEKKKAKLEQVARQSVSLKNISRDDDNKLNSCELSHGSHDRTVLENPKSKRSGSLS
ncbi:unnamed protein product [Owenia fusiformis]|uniref:Pseudouridine synthase RsuA/RluA-like domain-containing protein n=1 Tax=Owenia fusiformis TaxID=6347 RepID=A0A8S4PQ56_OWEFU|nr:unnamed protein product [Owenia fusiformis]